jgi:hypothetical protein
MWAKSEHDSSQLGKPVEQACHAPAQVIRHL